MYLCREMVETFIRFVIRVYAIKVNEILPDGLMSVNDKISQNMANLVYTIWNLDWIPAFLGPNLPRDVLEVRVIQ